MVFDVGEGTQHQLMRSQSIRQGKIRRIFVTHLHGDHLFGLPGLVTGLCGVRKDVARGDEYREAPDKLRIYGPRGIREFLSCALRVSSMKIPRDFYVHELVETVEEANEILNVRRKEPNGEKKTEIETCRGQEAISCTTRASPLATRLLLRRQM